MATLKLLKLTVSKVDGPIFNDGVISVVVPGADGVMTILANHQALISPLKGGEIVIIKSDSTKETHQIHSGLLEISENQATILI